MRNRLCGLTMVMLVIAMAHPAMADVAWAFTETALNIFFGNPGPDNPGTPVKGFTPGVEAYLIVSDAAFSRGTISYSNGCQGQSMESAACAHPAGDLDFLLIVEPSHFPRFPEPLNEPNLFYNYRAPVSLTFNFDQRGDLSGSITDVKTDDYLYMSVSNNMGSGRVGSDGTAMGCTDGNCMFTGYWALAQVPEGAPPVLPEPSSLLLFGAVLSAFGLFGGKRLFH